MEIFHATSNRIVLIETLFSKFIKISHSLTHIYLKQKNKNHYFRYMMDEDLTN